MALLSEQTHVKDWCQSLNCELPFDNEKISGVSFSFAALTLLSFSQLASLLINIFVFAVFARALLSWVNPGSFNAASNILYSVTEPLLSSCRRIIPDIGGIDLSPLIVLLGLQLTKMLIIPPLQQLMTLVS